MSVFDLQNPDAYPRHSSASIEAKEAVRQAHRTAVHVGARRRKGNRLTDRQTYYGLCMCGWHGADLDTAGEAQADGALHRRNLIRAAVGPGEEPAQ